MTSFNQRLCSWTLRHICTSRKYLAVFLSAYFLFLLIAGSLLTTQDEVYRNIRQGEPLPTKASPRTLSPDTYTIPPDNIHFTTCINRSDVTQRAPVPDQWQIVTDENFLVYSAYLDDRRKRIAKVTSIMMHRTRVRDILCQFWTDGLWYPFTISAKRITFPEQPARSHVATRLSCDLSDYPSTLPTPEAVSIVVNPCDVPKNLVRLRQLPKSQPPQYNYTVCLGGPLKFGFSNTNHFTEWLEMNSMFGADHFILYNHSASTQLAPYVDYYQHERSLIEWLPWHFPEELTDTQGKLKNFGHLGLVNDCLYRSMFRSKYVVYMDTDEFIVPRIPGVTTWDGLLETTECTSAGLLSVRCVFFKKEWSDDEQFTSHDIEEKFELLTQIKTKREEKIWAHEKRSKYIAKPDKVDVAGIHLVWGWIEPVERCMATPEQALMQHYRDWEDPDKPWLVDRHMHMYRDRLVDRVIATHNRVQKRKQDG